VALYARQPAEVTVELGFPQNSDDAISLGLLTYGSRVLALALLPPMPAGVAAVLKRMPAALFAGLATVSLVGPGGELAQPAVLAAALGALLGAPLRSLPICLVGGFVAYVLAAVLF
jgi:branched-subunit amino acid transport protein